MSALAVSGAHGLLLADGRSALALLHVSRWVRLLLAGLEGRGEVGPGVGRALARVDLLRQAVPVLGVVGGRARRVEHAPAAALGLAGLVVALGLDVGDKVGEEDQVRPLVGRRPGLV